MADFTVSTAIDTFMQSATQVAAAGNLGFVTTAAQTYTLPTTSATLARTDAAQSFTGIQTILGTSTLKFGATAAATIGVSADTTAGNLVFTGTTTGVFQFTGVSTLQNNGSNDITIQSTGGTDVVLNAASGRTAKVKIAGTQVFQFANNAGVSNLIGGAGNMSVTSGVGNSLTFTLQTTTSGGTATNALVANATQDISIPTGNLTVDTAGKTLSVKSGSNAKAGVVTLVAGAATVNTTAVTANSVIVLCVKTVSGTATGVRIASTVVGTSFTIAGVGTDAGTYNWMIFEVN